MTASLETSIVHTPSRTALVAFLSVSPPPRRTSEVEATTLVNSSRGAFSTCCLVPAAKKQSTLPPRVSDPVYAHGGGNSLAITSLIGFEWHPGHRHSYMVSASLLDEQQCHVILSLELPDTFITHFCGTWQIAHAAWIRHTLCHRFGCSISLRC